MRGSRSTFIINSEFYFTKKVSLKFEDLSFLRMIQNRESKRDQNSRKKIWENSRLNWSVDEFFCCWRWPPWSVTEIFVNEWTRKADKNLQRRKKSRKKKKMESIDSWRCLHWKVNLLLLLSVGDYCCCCYVSRLLLPCDRSPNYRFSAFLRFRLF